MMDIFITAPLPKWSGHNITLRIRPDRQRAFQYAKLYTADSAALATTSSYFRAAILERYKDPDPIVDLIWPDAPAVEGYLLWLEDRVIHSRPVNASSPPRKKVKLAKDAEASRSEQEEEDFRTLISLWLFGHRIQDVVFKDIVISLMEWMVKQPCASERFMAVLTPSVVASVWEMSDLRSKLCWFVVDTIARYAEYERAVGFWAGVGYLPSFRADLAARLVHSVPAHQLPADAEACERGLVRILLPYPPWNDEILGDSTTFEMVRLPHPPFEVEVHTGRRIRSLRGLKAQEQQNLARYALEVEKKQGMCSYHEHGDAVACWWDLAPGI